VSAFEARSVTRAEIESLASDAETVAETGRNVMQAAEATSREAAAVGAQRRKWQQVRRMVRKAVKGVPELEKKYAEC
jgi:FtsZ-binding cell division protein ZapB